MVQDIALSNLFRIVFSSELICRAICVSDDEIRLIHPFNVQPRLIWYSVHLTVFITYEYSAGTGELIIEYIGFSVRIPAIDNIICRNCIFCCFYCCAYPRVYVKYFRPNKSVLVRLTFDHAGDLATGREAPAQTDTGRPVGLFDSRTLIGQCDRNVESLRLDRVDRDLYIGRPGIIIHRNID